MSLTSHSLYILPYIHTTNIQPYKHTYTHTHRPNGLHARRLSNEPFPKRRFFFFLPVLPPPFCSLLFNLTLFSPFFLSFSLSLSLFLSLSLSLSLSFSLSFFFFFFFFQDLVVTAVVKWAIFLVIALLTLPAVVCLYILYRYYIIYIYII